MRVIVTLTIDGIKETRLEGETAVFDRGVKYERGYDSRLKDIGFWLSDWRYAEVGANNHKSRVFIPWTSCLLVETLEEEEKYE